MGMTMDQRATIAFQALLGFAGVVAIAPLVASRLIAQAHLSTQYAVLEILLILVIAVVPVAWRCALAGIRALTEPVSVLSIAFIFYYVLRGIVILLRHSIVRPDLILQRFALPTSNWRSPWHMHWRVSVCSMPDIDSGSQHQYGLPR
jgi:hypothetical protein